MQHATVFSRGDGYGRGDRDAHRAKKRGGGGATGGSAQATGGGDGKGATTVIAGCVGHVDHVTIAARCVNA